jgi:twitching motility protein PilT
MQTLAIDQDLQTHVTKALAECSLFRALKSEHLPQLVKVAELVQYEPEDVIIKQGDPSDAFYVLVRGEAAVTTEKAAGESIEIGRVPLPSSVGEVGLLLNENRTASVVAKSEVLALKFGAKAFEAMFQKIPSFGASLSAGLAHRLQQVSGRVQLPGYDREKPSAETVALLPVELIQRHRVLPLKHEGTQLTLGLVDDPNSQVLSSVRTLMPGADLNLVHIDATFFNDVMGSLAGVEEWKDKGAARAAAPAEAEGARSPRLDKLLERMVAEGASDVHLSAKHKAQWRIDGDMHTIADSPVLGPTEVHDLLAPVMEQRHRDQFDADNDTDFAYSLPGVARFRVNMFRDRNGIGAVLRQIPSKILTFEQLALPQVLAKLCDIPKGLVLVTGPTGSGKSTTLAAMIDYINKNKKSHVITLEDPIEFVHQSQSCLINQREVGGHTRTFARALKACLREDPDIVLVGEMRDLETISLALETANTGHLVFATLHTNSAISAVDRIIDQFPADQQAQIRSVLSDVLRGVVAQTLCKKIGGGRTAVLEILVSNYAVANLIREGKTNQLPSIMQANKAQGMALLNDELGRLIETKKIEMAEAMSKAVDKDDLARRFRSGVTLMHDPASGNFRVMAVVPASPGSEAGLERGDMVTEIDTTPSKDMNLDQARQAFRIDGKHPLLVERAGKRLKMTLELKR